MCDEHIQKALRLGVLHVAPTATLGGQRHFLDTRALATQPDRWIAAKSRRPVPRDRSALAARKLGLKGNQLSARGGGSYRPAGARRVIVSAKVSANAAEKDPFRKLVFIGLLRKAWITSLDAQWANLQWS